MEVSCVPTPPLPSVKKPLAENWCHTQIKVTKFSHMWTINNFSFCREVLQSSTFSASDNNKLKWRLHIKSKGIDMTDYLSLYFMLVSSNKTEVRAKYKFSILKGKQEQYVMQPRGVCRFEQGKFVGYDNFIRRELLLNEKYDLLPKDTLTILCEISVVDDELNISGQSNVQFKVPLCKLSDDLGKLMDNRKFSDVTLLVGDREFRAHKAILAVRSDVFAAMFEHDMVERRLNRVTITDVDHKVLKEMLRFVYTGKVQNLDKVAAGLLAAANKYALEKLKVMCEESLADHLSIDKAAETLILADLYCAYQLKAQTIDFINLNTDVIETVGWQNMITTHSYLVSETHRALATSPNGAQQYSLCRQKRSFPFGKAFILLSIGLVIIIKIRN